MEGNNHLLRLDPFIAQKIVNQLSKVISYNINIMDEKGLIIVGSIQNRLKMYHIAYQHCIWLLQYLKTPGSAKIYWFYHYVQPYLQSCLPLSELSGVYKAYSKMLPGKFWANYTPIIRQMNSNMNNMVKASAQLHMHKNTLVYRYNRIRDALHIDPMNHLSDAEFANNLCYYLEREKE